MPLSPLAANRTPPVLSPAEQVLTPQTPAVAPSPPLPSHAQQPQGLPSLGEPPQTSGFSLRQQGHLTLDGIPELPMSVIEALQPSGQKSGIGAVAWSPQGGLLVTQRAGQAMQVHAVDDPGAAPRQLSRGDEAVGEVMTAPGREELIVRRDKGGNELCQYYLLDSRSGAETLLTDGVSRNVNMTVDPQGKTLAYASTRANGRDYHLCTAPLADPQNAREVLARPGEWRPLSWAPDGKRLLVMEFISSSASRLHVLHLDSGVLEPIPASGGSAPVAYRAGAFTASGQGVCYITDADSDCTHLVHYDLATRREQVWSVDASHDVDAMAISPDGKWVCCVTNEAGASGLYVGAIPDSTTGTQVAWQRVDVPTGVIGMPVFNAASTQLAFTLDTGACPPAAYSMQLDDRSVVPWTTGGLTSEEARTMVAPTLATFPTFDGREISAWCYLPKQQESPAPVLLWIHGGPEAQARPVFNALFQHWVSNLGMAVVLPNVRGSSGYGKAYMALDDGPKREDSVRDIGAVLEWIGTQPHLDGHRVAVAGMSYGGYMSLSTMFHYPERIRCGIDGVGITHFVTFLEHTEAYRRDWRRAEYGDERDPTMRAFLASISPLTHVAEITKPLLVIHGEQDPRVPLSEATQLVEATRRQGLPVWYLHADNEGHGFQKTDNVLAQRAAMTVFLQNHLLPQ